MVLIPTIKDLKMSKFLLKHKRSFLFFMITILMVSIVAFKKVSLFGLIHKFNDSGHLLKSSTYNDNKVLSSRELLGPPTIKIDKGVSVKNYYHDGMPPYETFLKSWSSKEIRKLKILFNDSQPENYFCVFRGGEKGLHLNGNICDKS